jgi:hypothetical protein
MAPCAASFKTTETPGNESHSLSFCTAVFFSLRVMSGDFWICSITASKMCWVVTPELERLRDAVCPGQELSFLEITPLPWCKPNFCHVSVDEHIKTAGGSRQYCWKVWHYEVGYIEAEFHCLWRDPQGALHDISPDLEGETRILFFCDPVRTYQGTRQMHGNRVLLLKPEARANVKTRSDFAAKNFGRPKVKIVE